MTPEMNPSITNCANCNSPMPRELRFCRSCGFRLGEGSAEYTETVRFEDVAGGPHAAASSAPYGFAGGPLAAPSNHKIKKRRRRLSGMSWLFLGLLIFFVAAAAFTAIVRPVRSPGVNIQFGDRARTLSFVGVDEFRTTAGGVTFDNVQPPGSPADKAGLVGGDIITSIDGQVITTDEEASDLFKRIPPGKTLDVIYLRDGETKTAKITTISREERAALDEMFDDRPEGRGQFGYEQDAAERVAIPETKMFGVRLGEVLDKRPADVAGVKAGDIVIEFDGVPIRTKGEFLWRVRRALPYTTVTVVVMRGTEKLEIPMNMGRQ